MSLSDAIKETEAFLTFVLLNHIENGAVTLEMWSNGNVPATVGPHDQALERDPCVGLRIAEVSGWVPDGKGGGGGFSFMQSDLPDGALACFQAERMVISLVEGWGDDEFGPSVREEALALAQCVLEDDAKAFEMTTEWGDHHGFVKEESNA